MGVYSIFVSCSQGNVLQAPPLDEEQPGDIGEMLPSDFMGLHMGACTPKSNQAGTLAADLTPRPAVCTNPTEPAHSAVHPSLECAPSHSTDSYTTLVGLIFWHAENIAVCGRLSVRTLFNLAS
jgi:hypothetical protein